MTWSVVNLVKASALMALGLAVVVMGFYVAEADDAPGAAGMALVVMLAAVVLGVRIVRNRLPIWAGRAALVTGVLVAAFAAIVTRSVAAAVPLFAQPADVPSMSAAPPLPPWVVAVERARPIVRAAVAEQNLPGVSIAVGVDGDIVWAEGFGWRDVATHAPVTPDTRFNIGTAAPAVVAASTASLGMSNTGADSATEWSPGHIGEPEEDAPFFTLAHDVILRPLGVSAPAQPLPGHRATFYVPSAGDNSPRRGRRLMYMRDLACCADGMAFSSTPSDLVRFALATKADGLDGKLAGGTVMSLATRREGGIVVAVASNIAHADTAGIAQKVAEAFSGTRPPSQATEPTP